MPHASCPMPDYNVRMTRFARLISMALFFSLACTKSENPVPRVVRASRAKKATAKQQKAEEPGETSVGSTMPSYHAQSLDGTEFDLSSEKGNVILLNLWATWCKPCRFEIPELEKMHNDYAARGLKVIGVSLD